MGWGDELMAAGQARRRHAETGAKVQILGVDRRPRWSELWQGIPYIVPPGGRGASERIVNGPNARPYIAAKRADRWAWQPFVPTPAEVSLQAGERQLARLVDGAVVIEPTIKPGASVNKAWAADRWQQVVDAMPGVPFVQLGPESVPLLRGVRHVITRSFREAMGALSGARAYVGPEGGMHHASAALGVPAVVLFGGFISPAQTGYPTHRNLFTGEYACGWRVPCAHCHAAMRKITVDMVVDNLREVLDGRHSV